MLKRNSGFTLIELIVVIACISILAAISFPKFIDLTGRSKEASEADTVGNIKTGLQLYFSETMVNTTIGSYPAALDDATEGKSSPDNPFFANVLQVPYRNKGWEKQGSNRYVGPAGGIFVYNPADGSFVKQEE